MVLLLVFIIGYLFQDLKNSLSKKETNMQIIIPMSGIGKRFQREVYFTKATIDVDGKPIIWHVINMFPGENDFIFICNKDHLNEESYKMRESFRILPNWKNSFY